MFITFPFQLDLHIIVKRIAKYKKFFTDVIKDLVKKKPLLQGPSETCLIAPFDLQLAMPKKQELE